MRLNFKLILATELLASSLWLFGCGNYDQSKLNSDPGVRSEGLSPDFATVQQKVFQPRCNTCHSQYSSYQGVLREIAAIQSAVNAKRMPKSNGPLSQDELKVLNAWFQNGAPEKIGDLPVPPRFNELAPNWNSISENIIFPKCLVCHNPSGQAKFLDLSTRQKIFASRNRQFGNGSKLINFENPPESYLVQILKDEEEPMPPPVSNIQRLDEKQITIIEDWISLGLP